VLFQQVVVAAEQLTAI